MNKIYFLLIGILLSITGFSQAPVISDSGQSALPQARSKMMMSFMAESTPASSTLTTTFAANNWFDGNMFDVAVKNQGITITGLDINIGGPALTNVFFYYKVGSYVGSETNPANWILFQTFSNVTPNGMGVPTHIDMSGLRLNANTNYAFYVTVGDQNADMYYTNGAAVYENDDLRTNFGASVGGFFGSVLGTGSNSFFTPRIWNGTIYYNISCPENILVNNDPGMCGAIVSFDLDEGKISVPASGSMFPTGKTTVTVGYPGSETTCSFDVVVTDTEKPVISAPSSIVVNNDPGMCGAVVKFGEDNKIKVLLVCADGATNATDVQSKLMATGKFSTVDLFFGVLNTPSLSLLQQYESVLVWSNNEFLNSTLMGDVLVDYINAGGGVVLNIFSIAGWTNGIPQGAFQSSDYQVIEPIANPYGGAASLGTVHYPSHPLMEGVNSFTTKDYRAQTNILTPGSYRIAGWSDGYPLITAKENVGTSHVRRVDLNFFPGSSDVTGGTSWSSSTDGAVIMANALAWVATPTFSFPATDNCGVASVVTDIPSGTYFSVGTTNVTITAKDVNGNVATQTLTITVNDIEKPTIICPENITIGTDPGVCQAAVRMRKPRINDNCGIASVLNDAPVGFIFPKGETTVTWTVTDLHGNTTQCQNTVTVFDDEDPFIGACGKTYIVEMQQVKSGTTTVWRGNLPQAKIKKLITDNCDVIGGNLKVTFSQTIFTPQSWGTNTVKITATDAAGNVAGDGEDDDCNITVIVRYPLKAGEVGPKADNVDDFVKVENTTDINIYPNPTKGKLTIQMGTLNNPTVTAVVYNMAGSVVMKKNFSTEGQFEVDLTGLVNGMYTLKLTADGVDTVHKVVLKDR